MQLQRYELSGELLSAYTVKILSFAASVSGPYDFISMVLEAFPPLPTLSSTKSGEAQLDLRAWQSGHACDQWILTENDTDTYECHSWDELQSLIIWLINSRAVEWIGRDHLLFHAGAVAIGETGIILPAASGSGKSTLTAALIAQGCSYFSDEVAVIAPDDGSLQPFPKALKIEPDSLPVLANYYPNLNALRNGPIDLDGQPTYLHPPAASWPNGPVAPRYVIVPRYQAGATTRLGPLSRADAFERLLAHSFSAGSHAAEGVHQIVQLLRGCACYDLTMGDLDDAVSLIMSLKA